MTSTLSNDGSNVHFRDKGTAMGEGAENMCCSAKRWYVVGSHAPLFHEWIRSIDILPSEPQPRPCIDQFQISNKAVSLEGWNWRRGDELIRKKTARNWGNAGKFDRPFGSIYFKSRARNPAVKQLGLSLQFRLVDLALGFENQINEQSLAEPLRHVTYIWGVKNFFR